jgi:hypothetical protein
MDFLVVGGGKEDHEFALNYPILTRRTNPFLILLKAPSLQYVTSPFKHIL